ATAVAAACARGYSCAGAGIFSEPDRNSANAAAAPRSGALACGGRKCWYPVKGGVTSLAGPRSAARRQALRGGLMALALAIGKCSILGNYRENNEDAIEAKQFPDMTVCIVADGMGGQAAGEIASNRAIGVLPRELRRGLLQATGPDQSKAVIKKAVVQANEEIMAMG